MLTMEQIKKELQEIRERNTIMSERDKVLEYAVEYYTMELLIEIRDLLKEKKK